MIQVFKNKMLNPTIERPSQLVEACVANVTEKQNALMKKYNLDQVSAYGINEEKGLIRFKLKDNSSITFTCVPAGVWNAETNQWIWSWSNTENNDGLYHRSTELKGLSEIISSDDFTQPIITCDAYRSQALSCIAGEYMDGIGRFVAPQGNFRIHFILLKKI